MEGGGDDKSKSAQTLHEILFDISDTLSSKYPSLDPFKVRKEKTGVVFNVLFGILEKSRREKGLHPGDTTYVDAKGRTHIRRQSTNDNFF